MFSNLQMPLTPEQADRIARNKAQALKIQQEKERLKPSASSIKSWLSSAVKNPAEQNPSSLATQSPQEVLEIDHSARAAAMNADVPRNSPLAARSSPATSAAQRAAVATPPRSPAASVLPPGSVPRSPAASPASGRGKITGFFSRHRPESAFAAAPLPPAAEQEATRSFSPVSRVGPEAADDDELPIATLTRPEKRARTQDYADEATSGARPVSVTPSLVNDNAPMRPVPTAAPVSARSKSPEVAKTFGAFAASSPSPAYSPTALVHGGLTARTAGRPSSPVTPRLVSASESTSPATPRLVSQSTSPSTPRLASVSPSTPPMSKARPVTPASAKSDKSAAAEDQSGRLPWLADPKDMAGRRPDDPRYDPSTLLISKSELAALSKAQQQYWAEYKRWNYDTIVFFQQGFFHNVFEADADICVRLLGWNYTGQKKTNLYSAGVSSSQVDGAMARLISLGYKVMRVDQATTVAGGKKKRSGDETEQRHVQSVVTPGTVTDEAVLTGESTYLMAVKEFALRDMDGKEQIVFGIALLDASLGQLRVGRLDDDRFLTLFETLLYQYKPKEIVFPRGGMRSETKKRIQAIVSLPMFTGHGPTPDAWTPEQCLAQLSSAWPAAETWPPTMQQLRRDNVSLAALGGLLSYLNKLGIDESILRQQNVCDLGVQHTETAMVLDGQTVRNLELLVNSEGREEDGTLLHFVNHTHTPFGRRLLRQWICHPLLRADDINNRLNAVEELIGIMTSGGCGQSLFEKELAALPDVERKLSKIQSGRQSLADMLQTIEGFDRMQVLMVRLEREYGVHSKLLLEVARAAPSIDAALAELSSAFDWAESKTRGGLVLLDPSICPELRQADEAVRAAKEQKDEAEAEARTKFGASKSTFGKGFVEMPKRSIGRMKASGYEVTQMSDKIRVTNDAINDAWNNTLDAQKAVTDGEAAAMKVLTEMIWGNIDCWKLAIASIAKLDCLLSLAQTSFLSGLAMVRPEVSEPLDRPPFIELRQFINPTMASATTFIPNDVDMGFAAPPIVLLTGANMGGKSTVLRSVCHNVILAQLGCFVPAERFALSPVDRIFTRLGASDEILRNQSTFMVEASETAAILHSATSRSLVIVDELGRGTATYDGYAIAYAVLSEFADNPCRLLFATHFHQLADDFKDHKFVQRLQMDSTVDDQGGLVFLYSLVPGVAPKSFGTNVARMAGIDESVVREAETMATRFEASSTGRYKLQLSHCAPSQAQPSSPAAAAFCRLMSTRPELVSYEQIADLRALLS
eukprot:TRINITY_DN3201_c0_g1_i1.p1 TRINITY_DN3201_c0_g1~~TRINITY_DN3201_c0_g1_i1.p1  ORF type:complete len:1293 (+),score=371.32 TRINITY_DN3201_c0_g1_i1:91-3879(+)